MQFQALPEHSVSLIQSIDVLHSISLLVISVLFLSEYKEVINSELASQKIARSFKARGSIHCSHWEQPHWLKEDFRKVWSSPGAESVSRQYMISANYSLCSSLEGQIETRWCLELFKKQEESQFRNI